MKGQQPTNATIIHSHPNHSLKVGLPNIHRIQSQFSFLTHFLERRPISPTNAEQTIKPCPNEAPAAVLQVGKPGLNPSASLTNLSTTSSLGMQTSTSLMQPEGLKIS